MRDSRLKRNLIKVYEDIYFVVDNTVRWIVLRTKYRVKIMSSYKTLKYIQKNKCSIARYGDAEISFVMNSEHDLSYQSQSGELCVKLKDVLSSNDSNLLVCIPRYLSTLKGCTKKCKRYWWNWGKQNECQKEIINELKKFNGKKFIYGDSLITRPYMDRLDVRYAEKIFYELKNIWDGKDLLIIEGEQTRLGVGNDLFENAKSIERILAPALNAYEKYDKVKESVLKHYSGQIVLIALGPTATILAADLSIKRIQALDIGHVDIEYEWFKNRQTEKVAIQGKYTNEVVEGRTFTECFDKEYQRQIIDIID